MAVMDIILKAIDKVSPVVDKMAKNSNASFATMQKKFKAAEGSLMAVGGAMVIAGGIVAVVSGKLIKMASDAEETSSKFATVFQAVSEESEAMAKNLSRNYGLSSTAAKKMLGDTGDLLTGFGFTGEAALDLAGDVGKLAVDLASFTNYSGGAEGASQALTKALLGERESVKLLGISILEEDVKAKVALLTKQGMTFETERQAKAYATLLIAQEQSKNAIGDFERTSESFANQQRILNARLGDLAVTLGDKILPVATKVMSWMVSIVEKVTDWTEKHPILTGILVKFGVALGALVGTGGLLILGALAFIKMAGAIKTSLEFYRSFAQVLPLVTAKVWAFTASLLANPITWWVIGITAAIAAIVLLWKNWEKISGWISDKIDWICDKFKWLGDKIKWVAEKLGIYKEKTDEITESTEDLKEATDEAGESIDELKAKEEEAKETAELLKDENLELADSLDTVGEKADEAADSIKIYAEGIAENYIQLSIDATKSWADFYAFWEAEAKRTAEEIKRLNKEVEETTPGKKPSNLYKIVDAEGNTIGLQSGNILSQAAADAGVTLVKIHGGGEVRTTIPGGEGIALLKDREVIREPGYNPPQKTEVNINVSPGAIVMTSTRIDEGAIKNAGKWLFEEIHEQFRANNIKLVWG
ncbi:MAG: hypothetical protein IMF19_02940 [Proteobacteria bacterium]|nr:hypothetical protein [Pseudomonadota bacterium]